MNRAKALEGRAVEIDYIIKGNEQAVTIVGKVWGIYLLPRKNGAPDCQIHVGNGEGEDPWNSLFPFCSRNNGIMEIRADVNGTIVVVYKNERIRDAMEQLKVNSKLRHSYFGEWFLDDILGA